MSHVWPSETVFERVDLFLDGQGCNFCETDLEMWGHRQRRVFTLHGPRLLVVRLGHCPDPECAGHHESVSAWGEMAIAPARLTVAWDVFAWIGHRRFARHWCVPQICGELCDSHQIDLSEDALEDYVRRYETMVAARQGDMEELRKVYAAKKSLILSIDGLQPEKGHETLYVVRELTQKRVWFAEPLLSSTNDEVQRLTACIDRGLDLVEDVQTKVRLDVEKLQAVADTLDPAHGSLDARRGAFDQLQQRFSKQKDPVARHLVKLMISFVAGLFVGPVADLPDDNLDLERWFRKPKSHERRIHGRRHAGIRLVQEGPTLVLTLDAHMHHPEPFVAEDLIPYRCAQPPPSQQAAIACRRIMRRARSSTKRAALLAELEQRYRNTH